jgi:hypothetical protein
VGWGCGHILTYKITWFHNLEGDTYFFCRTIISWSRWQHTWSVKKKPNLLNGAPMSQHKWLATVALFSGDLFFLICIVGGGIKVHSTLRPLNDLLSQPQVIMIMEKSVEWLAGETKVLGENLPQCHFVHYKPHMLPVCEGRRGGKPASNRWATARPLVVTLSFNLTPARSRHVNYSSSTCGRVKLSLVPFASWNMKDLEEQRVCLKSCLKLAKTFTETL